MGPLPESQGNKYILFIGNQFSKWYEAVALPNQGAKTVSRLFVEDWIVRFGCESNLNKENQSETEDASNSLNVTNDMSENEANDSEQEIYRQ